MQINASPRIFSDKDYLSASFFLQVPAKKMKSINFIPVSPLEYRKLDMPEYTNNEYSIKIKYIDNIIYYVNVADMQLLCVGYILIYSDVFQIMPMLASLKEWQSRNKIIDAHLKEYEDYLNIKINDLLKKSPTFRFNDVSIKSINRIMSKHRGSAKINGEFLILTFNKIRCGNETEGYVNYKFIEIHFRLTKLGVRGTDPYNVVYGFQNFSIDSKNGISGIYSLHPHIRQNHICFGNRQDDWNDYTKIINFPFIIDLLYENLNNYEPSDAYMSVNEIVKAIKTLNVVYKNYKKMNPLSSPENIANHIFSGMNKCLQCLRILDVNGECFSNGCEANPNAIVKCDRCGTEKKRDKFIENLGVYKWYCQNTGCSESPKWDSPLREQLTCPYCGDPLRDEGLERLYGNYEGIELPDDGDGYTYRVYSCNNREHNAIRSSYQKLVDEDGNYGVIDFTVRTHFQKQLNNEEYNILNKTEEKTNEI